jgi:ribonucleotide reductase beta subunit family protein with ferritin-like domain
MDNNINNKKETYDEFGELIYDADTEPLLNPKKTRFTILPIEYQDIWDMYETQLGAFWKADEIDFSKDYDDFITLSKDEQHFIKMTLAFFAASDGIVNFNLRDRFLNDVKIMEAQVAYTFQMMMENIHGLVYSRMLDNLIKDHDEKEKLFNAIKTVPVVKKMADWAFKWIESTQSFPYRLIAFAAVEGIFFSGSFASIDWIKKYVGRGRLFLQGLTKSNEFIARDEGMHTNFACLLYSKLNHKLKQETVNTIIKEAVSIAQEFSCDAIPCKFIGMNLEMMKIYIEYVADRLMVSLGYQKIYHSQNTLSFTESRGLASKNNFFESRTTEYQMALGERAFEISNDF